MSYNRLLGEEIDLIKFEGVPRKASRFGDGKSLLSLGTYAIPAWIAGQDKNGCESIRYSSSNSEEGKE